MRDPENAPKWRMRAEQIRNRAYAAKTPADTAALLGLAEQWTSKADAAEAPAKTTPQQDDGAATSALRWRQHAADLRGQAANATDPDRKATLLALAEDWERLARPPGAEDN